MGSSPGAVTFKFEYREGWSWWCYWFHHSHCLLLSKIWEDGFTKQTVTPITTRKTRKMGKMRKMGKKKFNDSRRIPPDDSTLKMKITRANFVLFSIRMLNFLSLKVRFAVKAWTFSESLALQLLILRLLVLVMIFSLPLKEVNVVVPLVNMVTTDLWLTCVRWIWHP